MQMQFVSEDGRTLVVAPDEDGDGARIRILAAPPAAEAAEETGEEEPAEEPGFYLTRQDIRLLGNSLVTLAKTQCHR